jgi:hypothetical protein
MTPDRWHTDVFKKNLVYHSFFSDTERLLTKLLKHPCYFDLIQWGPLSDQEYEEYVKLRNAKVFEAVERLPSIELDTLRVIAYNLRYRLMGSVTGEMLKRKISPYHLLERMYTDPKTGRKLWGMAKLKSAVDAIQKVVGSQLYDTEAEEGTEEMEEGISEIIKETQQ